MPTGYKNNIQNGQMQCGKCGNWYPIEPQYWRRKGGEIISPCAECHRAWKREWAKNNPDKIRAMRQKDRARHKESYDKRGKLWREENQERVKAYRQQYYEENKEAINEKVKQWQRDNPEKINKRTREWAAKHPEVGKARRAKRRALIAQSDGGYTSEELQDQYNRQKGKCYWCGGKLKKGWHADHVIPLSRGGANDISNIVCVHAKCNLSKYNKLPHEWEGGGGKLL